MSDAPRRPLLEAAGIGKRFGAVRALDDVSLNVAAGEVHGLLGANGAGKSTLIGILSGAVRPDSGELRVAGDAAPLGSLSAARAAGLTVVHQELMLFPDRTVEENVFASVLPQGAFRWTSASARRDRVEATLRRLGAAIDPNARVGDLPLAHRQLVEIARALCIQPKFILLDEPFSGIDPIAVLELQKIIFDLKASGIGILITDHNVRETLSVTDRAYIIAEGRIFRAGTPHELGNDVDVRRVYLGEGFSLG